MRAAEYVTFFWFVDGKTGCTLGILCSARSCHSPLGWGLSYAEKLKDIVYSLSRHQDPDKAAPLFLDCSSSVSASSPFPDLQLFEHTLWNSGKVVEAEWRPFPTEETGKLCTHEPHKVLSGFKGEQSLATNTPVLSNSPTLWWDRFSDWNNFYLDQ